MKTKNIIVWVVVIIVIILVVVLVRGNGNELKETGENTYESPVGTVPEGTPQTEDAPELADDTGFAPVGSYETYAPEKIAEKSATSRVVLFFRASWCPTCRALDKDIRANPSLIPGDVTILDVDYDNSKELKQKYGVTYQHTLVQVDAQGNMVKKWKGSPTLSLLVQEVQ